LPTDDSPLAALRGAHARFLELVRDLRPERHRYCARMTGSVIDGEDLVQETLARAYFELSQLRELPALRAWLFRMAHHLAIDQLRRRRYAGLAETLDEEDETPDERMGVEARLVQGEAVGLALARFAPLPPSQRAAVILKDVLGFSLEEIASMLETTVQSVKAALHRGRVRLGEAAAQAAPPAPRPPSPVLVRYAQLFNARDWEGVRSMLIDDVKLDLVSREKRRGLAPVSGYFTNYGLRNDWHLSPAWLHGREVLAVRTRPDDPRPRYVIELELSGERVASIRDFRYVPYLLDEVRTESGDLR